LNDEVYKNDSFDDTIGNMNKQNSNRGIMNESYEEEEDRVGERGIKHFMECYAVLQK
jgi:hypothetical protein